MSKIGVGVGEDFPVDDTNQNTGGPGAPRRDDDADYQSRREAHRRWREQRHEWKRQWREEWHARRRAFRDSFHESHYEGGHRHPWGYRGYWSGPALWRLIAIAAAIALIVFTLSHIYFILGALVLLALFAAAARHGFDPFDLPPRDYDRRREPPRASTPPPAGDTH